MPPHPVFKKEAPAPTATLEMIEERAWKAHEHLAEKHCREASEERREMEEIERMERQAAEQKVAREREEKAEKEREKVCLEAACKATEDKKTKEQAETAQKATEVKKAGVSNGKGPVEASGSPRKAS
jgi:Na+/phosphate symporter